MKNAKDYIKETSPNTQRITSLAYWLTPEGLDNPITAAMLRETLSNATDEEFSEAFDGATKAEAAMFLEQWEFCFMAHWGAPELAKVIALSDAGRSEALALRAVNMAQGAKELPEVFSPMEGIQWAMGRGYLIGGNICAWCGVQPGSYGHPSNPLSTADASAAKVQDGAGTSPSCDDKPWLIAATNDPEPDYPWYTPARYFARQLVKDDSTLLVKREKLAEKTAASLAGVGVFKRGKKKLPLSAGTVLKSFVNVMLN